MGLGVAIDVAREGLGVAWVVGAVTGVGRHWSILGDARATPPH